MANIIFLLLPLFTRLWASQPSQSRFDPVHFSDLNVIKHLKPNHTANKVFRSILLIAQESRKLPHMFSYYTQQYAWNLYDSMDQQLMTKAAQKPFRILSGIVQEMGINYESKLQKYYTADSFLEYCVRESFGIIWILQTIEVVTTETANVEIRALLSSPSTEYDPAGTFISGVNDLNSGDARGSLYRQHLTNAISHWREYVAGLLVLSDHNINPFLSSIFTQLVYPHQTLAARILVLHEAFPKIFKLDHRLTGTFLHTSWNLVQYLKHMSRLLTNEVLKQNIMDVSDRFYHHLKLFVSEKDLLISRCKLIMTNESRICRHSSGCIIKSAHFFSVPLSSAGPTRDHYLVMKNGPNGFRPFTLGKDTPTDGHLFVYLSEPVFTKTTLLEEYKQKYIRYFCKNRDLVD